MTMELNGMGPSNLSNRSIYLTSLGSRNWSSRASRIGTKSGVRNSSMESLRHGSSPSSLTPRIFNDADDDDEEEVLSDLIALLLTWLRKLRARLAGELEDFVVASNLKW
jgi:hypothetical protein